MSNFKQAIEYLRQGKKIRRRSWNKGDFIVLEGSSIVDKNRELVKLCNIKTLTAEDWEIFKEEEIYIADLSDDILKIKVWENKLLLKQVDNEIYIGEVWGKRFKALEEVMRLMKENDN